MNHPADSCRPDTPPLSARLTDDPRPPSVGPVPRGRLAARGFLWSGAGFGAQGVFQLLLLVVLARRLTPADFGVIQGTLVAVGLGQLFTRSIVGPALVQKPVIEDRHVETALTVALVSSLVTAAGLFALAGPISHLFNDDRLVVIMRVLQIGFLIQVPAVIAEALLQRELQFRAIAVAQFTSYLVGYAMVGVVLGIGGAGVWSLVGAQLGQLATYTTILLAYGSIPLRARYDRDAARELIHFGGGFTLGRLFNYAALQGDFVVVGSMLSETALGIYGRAYQLLATPAMLLGQVMDRVMFPMLADIQDDMERVRLQYRRAVAIIALGMLPLSTFVVITAPEIVSVSLGSSWESVVTPLRILALSLLARTSYKVSDSLCRSLGLVYQRAKRQFLYALLVVAGAAIGQGWGVPGVAVGVAAAVVMNFLIMAQLSTQAISMTWTEFATAHLRGVATTAMLTPVMLLANSISRELDLPDLATLFVTTAAGGLTLILLLMWGRAIIIGPEVEWLLSVVRPVAKTPPPATTGES